MAVAENLAFRTFDVTGGDKLGLLADAEGDARKCAQS